MGAGWGAIREDIRKSFRTPPHVRLFLLAAIACLSLVCLVVASRHGAFVLCADIAIACCLTYPLSLFLLRHAGLAAIVTAAPVPGILVLLAAWCGLRLGEALALTRADVDLKEGSVSIDKSAAELKSGERIVGPPKTKAGMRKVFVPPHVVPALARHLEHFSGGPAPSDLVFTGTLGQPVRRGSLYTAWMRATKAAGMDGVRIHDLRHTGATLAAATGASTKELMNRLGHASSDAALRYQHATKDRDAAIAAALSELVERRDENR